MLLQPLFNFHLHSHQSLSDITIERVKRETESIILIIPLFARFAYRYCSSLPSLSPLLLLLFSFARVSLFLGGFVYSLSRTSLNHRYFSSIFVAPRYPSIPPRSWRVSVTTLRGPFVLWSIINTVLTVSHSVLDRSIPYLSLPYSSFQSSMPRRRRDSASSNDCDSDVAVEKSEEGSRSRRYGRRTVGLR